MIRDWLATPFRRLKDSRAGNTPFAHTLHTARDARFGRSILAAALLCGLVQYARAAEYIRASDAGLSFPADANGYRIPDFSYAGYMNSNEPLPAHGVEYVTKVTLTSPSGDETTRVQKAIDSVSAMPLNSDGYRGAVVLGPGTWKVNTLSIKADGVVLRGSGRTATIIQDEETLPAQTICVGVSSVEEQKLLFDDGRSGTKWNITTPVVNVGDMSFDVVSGHSLRAGDAIIIEHPCTDAWLKAIGGGAPGADAWSADEVPIRYHRYVTAVSGTRITVDAPVMYSLVKSRAQCFVFKYTVKPVRRVGIENMTLTHTPSDGVANSSIRMNRAEHCWIRNVTVTKFKQQGVNIQESTRITIEKVEALDPSGALEGGNRYGITSKGAQLVLTKDSFGRRNRHTFIGGGHAMDSGNVWLRCVATDNYAAVEDGHQRWTNGTLFDNCVFRQDGSPESGTKFDSKLLWIGNHGDNSNGHGWASCTAVVYKCEVAKPGYAIVAKPPTGMNYVIASSGEFRSDHSTHGDYPGALSIPTSGTLPKSLFEAQLAQRQLGSTPEISVPAAPTGFVVSP